MLSGYLLDNAEARERLSPQERLYSSNFFVVLGRHLKASVLDELPHHYASLVRSPRSLCLSPTSLPFVFLLTHLFEGNVPELCSLALPATAT
jgi:hypothetical protein